MAKDRRSFFERLTGSVNLEEYEDEYEEEERHPQQRRVPEPQAPMRQAPVYQAPQQQARTDWMEEEASEGELAVDMYQTPEAIILRTFVAGVRPEDLDVSISRDMVTLKGRREVGSMVADENYFHRELYWGSFTRTILLPQEIDTEAAEASENHGLITIKLPKIDKGRQMKLKVKGH